MVDFDSYSDWIEIYNPLDEEFDFSGYFVTDNLSDPLKWKVPRGTVIPPDGYLLLWADGFNDMPGVRHYRPYWPYQLFTTQNYHTNFRLSRLGEEIGIFKLDNVNHTMLISSGDLWQYYDNGENGNDWYEPDFPDSLWQSGASELGYGDGDEATVIGFGGDTDNRYPTSYFRKTFEVDTPDSFHSITLKLVRDDGAVVYLNGIEIVRTNMPLSTISYNTFSVEPALSPEESRWFEWQFDTDLLKSGVNTCAVEVHQFRPTSSDLSFNLELVGEKFLDVTLIDSVTYQHQYRDVSYGRSSTDADKWEFFSSPTPKYSNNTPSTATPFASSNVRFSLSGGFYDSGISLELSSPDPSAVIYYTDDGTSPGFDSKVYESELQIDATTYIKARSYEDGGLLGTVTTHTYFIDEEISTLPVFSIVTDPYTLWDEEYGIYTNNYKQREVPVDITYFDGGDRPGIIWKAGVKIGGLNIWRFAQKPLTLYFRNRHGYDALNYHIFPSKQIGIFNRLVLRNGGDNWPNAMLRDAMTESIISGQMENGCQAYLPCVVYLNGSYWGIHNLREKFDSQYLNQNINLSGMYYDHLEYTFDRQGQIAMQTVVGEPGNWLDLLAFIESNDLADSSNYNIVKSQIDIDNFIDFAIIEQYMANTSWKHNREWWRPHADNSKWHWLIPDLDKGYNPVNLTINFFTLFKDNYSLFDNLVENREFLDRFIARYTAHLNSTFRTDRMIGIVDSLNQDLLPEVPYHIAKWSNQGGMQSIQSRQNSIDGIKSFINQRSSIVFNQLNRELNSDGFADLTFNVNVQGAGRFMIADVPMLPDFSTGKFLRNLSLKIKAIPEVGYHFAGWEGLSDRAEIKINLTADLVLQANFIKYSDNVIPHFIDANTTLTSENSPYLAIGDVVINADVELKIDKGVTILMPTGGNIIVRGKLDIAGTERDPVLILPNSNIGTTHWGALCFVEPTDSSVINHVVIKGATHGSDPINLKAAISAFHAIIEINHALLEDVDFPIFTQFGSTVVRNSSISTDIICDYINIKYGEAVVENCVFYGNNSSDTDAIDYDQIVNGIIRNNRIYNFSGFNSDGIDIGEQSQAILITENIIFKSMDKGISIGQQSSVTIERNLIIGCNQGITVKDMSYAMVNQNTFFENNYAVASIEKNPGAGGGNIEVKNSIFSNCLISNYLVDSLSSISIDYSLSDTLDLLGDNNISADPKFIHPLIYDFELQSSSPCINSGDPDMPNDFDGTPSDIGAYYTYSNEDIPGISATSLIINELNYQSSVDFDADDWVEIYNPTDTLIDISFWKLIDSNDEHSFYFSDLTYVHAGGFLVICRDSARFLAVYPGVKNFIGNLSYGFSNKGDRVSLYDSKNLIVDYLTYDVVQPWPNESSEFGSTIELINPDFDNRMPQNWKSATDKWGTPGRRNSVYYDSGNIPGKLKIDQNFPNPFNSTTVIPFSISFEQIVEVSIYDIVGRRISTIINQRFMPGSHQIPWDSQNLSAGVYILSIKAETQFTTLKMVKLK